LLETSLYENQIPNIINAQSGDKSALEELINNNNGLIWSIVKRFKDRGYDLEDLYQIAVVGFIKSIKKFDTDYEVKLSTYAVPYILGEIKRYIQTEGPIKISRSIKELLYKISEVQKEYLKKGQEATIEEIAKEIGVDKEDIVIALESNKPVNSIYEEKNDDEGLATIDRVSTGLDEQTMITNKIVLTDLINNLKDKEKQIVLMRYFRGKTQNEVAAEMNMSQVQVSRIERRVLDTMKKKLAEDSAIIA